MSDSDKSSDDESSPSSTQTGLNLTGFLFGNIDRDGALEENFLDEACKKKLGGLSAMLGAGIGQILADEAKPDVKPEEDYEDGTKDPDAQDFSSINEALTDDSSSASEAEEDKTEAKTEPKKEETEEAIKEEPMEVVEVKKEAEDEAKLMPPPSSMPKPVSPPAKKPLASMRPDKYKNVDITELFPEFRDNKVLRFSRLFPIKSSHKPRFWKNVKRRFKVEDSEDDQESESSPAKRTKDGEWVLNVAPAPTDPDAYVEDQAVRFHRPFQAKTGTEKEANNEKKDERSKVSVMKVIWKRARLGHF